MPRALAATLMTLHAIGSILRVAFAPVLVLYLLLWTPMVWWQCLLAGVIALAARNCVEAWAGVLLAAIVAPTYFRKAISLVCAVVWIAVAIALIWWCVSYFFAPYPGLLSTVLFFGLMTALWLAWNWGGAILLAYTSGMLAAERPKTPATTTSTQ